MNRVLPVIVLALTISLLAGCGKKPGSVDAPPGVNPDPFPRMYPNQASEGSAPGRSYPTPASEGQPAGPVFPDASTDPFARVYPNPADGIRR